MNPFSVQSRRQLLCALCLLSGCSSNDTHDTAAWAPSSDAGSTEKSAPSTSKASKAASTAGTTAAPARKDQAAPTEGEALTTLQWKRASALEADLSRALELSPETLCREFGTASCVNDVHLVPLGGSDPFITGMFEPAAEPLASTPTVVERIVLSACTQRAELDRKAGAEAKVFKQLPLDGAAPAPDDAKTQALVADLFQRLLSRDATKDELAIIAALARDDSGKPISASDFAKVACLSIGSSAEFLFF